MADNRNKPPTGPGKGRQKGVSNPAGDLTGIVIKADVKSNAKEVGKDVSEAFENINKKSEAFLTSYEKKIERMTEGLRELTKATTIGFGDLSSKMQGMIEVLDRSINKKIKDTAANTTNTVKEAAKEAEEASQDLTTQTEKNAEKTATAFQKAIGKIKEAGQAVKTFLSGLGPAIAQGLTASFGIFFNIMGRLKEYDTFLGQLHTKITNRNNDLDKYKNILLDQSIVGKDELSFGLTPEQRKEALGTFATFASESEKYGSRAAENVKGLTEGASGLLKGIGIPIAEASASLMDLHKKVGLTYKEMENFSLSMTSLYRKSNMTTDQFKKMLDVLPNIARAYGMSTKAAKDFTMQSAEVGVALSSVGLNADEMLGKMNKMAEGSEEGLIQSMILGLKPGDSKGNLEKFASQARSIFAQTGGENANATDLYMRRQLSNVMGLGDMSMDQITALAKGTYKEEDGKLKKETPEEKLKETAEALRDVALKYERPFVTLDQQISQFFTEMETRVVKKFSNAVNDFKDIMLKVGSFLKKAVEFVDNLTGGGGMGVGKLGVASLVLGMLVGPLTAGVIKAITNAFGMASLGRGLLRMAGLSRFSGLLGTVSTGSSGAAVGGASATAATGGGLAAAGVAAAKIVAVLGAAIYAGRFISNFSEEIFGKEKWDKLWDGVLSVWETTKEWAVKIKDYAKNLGVLIYEKNRIMLEALADTVSDLFKPILQYLKDTNPLIAAGVEKAWSAAKKAFDKTNKEAVSVGKTAIEKVEEAVTTAVTPAKEKNKEEKQTELSTAAAPSAVTASTEQQKVMEQLITDVAQEKGVDPKFAVINAKIESVLDPNAHSTKSSAEGLFQLLDKTAEGYGVKKEDKRDPVKNTEAGISALKDIASSLGIDSTEVSSKEAQLITLVNHIGAENLNKNVWKSGERDLKKEAQAHAVKIAKAYGDEKAFSVDELYKLYKEKKETADIKAMAKSLRIKELKDGNSTQTVVQKEEKPKGDMAKAVEAATTNKPHELTVKIAEGLTTKETRGGTPTIEPTKTEVAEKATAATAQKEPVEDAATATKPTSPSVSDTFQKPSPVKVEDTTSLKEVHDKQTYNVLREIANILKNPPTVQPPVATPQSSGNPWISTLLQNQDAVAIPFRGGA